MGISKRSNGIPNKELQGLSNPGALPKKLPLIHVTEVGSARDIVLGKQLETRRCKVFNTDLLYFFALRPAYRSKDGDEKTDLINKFPFVFVVSPDAVQTPHHVYPFDTGGAVSGVFGDGDPHVYLEDYELKPEHLAVAGHIGWAFSNLDAYFEGELRNDIETGVAQFKTVTRGYIHIARLASSGSNQPDKRASAIEVAANHHVPLKDNVKLVILPKQYLDDPDNAPGQPNEAFIKQLNDQHISWEVYDWQPNIPPNEFQNEIARITKEWLQKNGHL